MHFFPDDPPDSIARKALRVNLSDLAAKGATPLGYLLSLALPDTTGPRAGSRTSPRASPATRSATASRCSAATPPAPPGATVISITAFGLVPKGRMVRRSGARAGDLVFVSGTIGDAALGLLVRLGKLAAAAKATRHLLDRYLHPEPRVALGAGDPALRDGAMDVSDGLVGDLGHICKASGVGAEIEAEAVPLSPAARSVIGKDEALLRTALTGGDDYEVLATVPPRSASAFERAAGKAGMAVTRIGQMTAGKPAVTVLGPNGKPLRFQRGSFDHFRSG